MSDSSSTPLTESILQKLYKSKTYVRDGKWDVLWYLGGKNNVTIGEKSGRFYLIPNDSIETVTDMLPFELVQEQHSKEFNSPKPLETTMDLKCYFPEIQDIQNLPL